MIIFTILAELKKYTSFEALKSDKKPGDTNRDKINGFTEFEAFLKRLRNENSNKKKTKTESNL